MSTKSRILAAAAGLTLLGGFAVPAIAANASSAGCAFTNGCATLQGFDAANHAVAMDAKYKVATQIVIGYPDVPGDGATNFDAVLHYTSGKKVTTYQDTALQANDLHFACTVTGLIAPVTTSPAGGTITDGGNQLNVENAGGAGFTVNSGTSLGFTGTLSVTTALDETASSGCTVLYTWNGTEFVLVPPAGAGAITESYIGGGVTQFSDSASTSGGKFSFDTLPAGVATTADSIHGDLDALTSTAVPGTYSSVGVTYTEADGSQITEAFELVVSGIKSVSPGPGVPFYTFVYAKDGVWSSQCVTDADGSGALAMQACTLGKNQYQDFFALDASGNPSGSLADSTSSFRIQNLLASVANPADSCLTDPSSLNPATPETNVTDETASPAGRQLRVNGSCTLGENPWTWAS